MRNVEQTGHADERSEHPADGSQPPGPDGLPLLGNTHQFLRDPPAFYDHVAATYGDVVTYEVMGERGYMVRHPDDIEQVLVTDSDRFVKGQIFQETLEPILGNGLVVAEGDLWERQRMLLQPAFTPQRIQSYTEDMVTYTESMLDGWQDGETVRLTEELKSLTLQILASALFDRDIRGEDTVVHDAADAIIDRVDPSSVVSHLPMWVPHPTNWRAKRALSDLDDYIDRLIAERRADDAAHDDLLTILLHAETEDGEGMSDEQLRDELVTFLFAGHETTSMTLTYTLYLLAEHPEARERLHAELGDVLGGATPTVEDIFELEYTEWAIKEAMRIIPPVFTLFREPTEDVEIGGYTIPEGRLVVLPQWVVHRDARWYEDPRSYRPGRWADDLEAELPDYAYFPFGGGPRHCIGMRFAMTEMQLVLATLAQRVDLDTAFEGELGFQVSATTQPDRPVEMTVTER